MCMGPSVISLQTAVFSVGSGVTKVTVFISPALLHVASPAFVVQKLFHTLLQEE